MLCNIPPDICQLEKCLVVLAQTANSVYLNQQDCPEYSATSCSVHAWCMERGHADQNVADLCHSRCMSMTVEHTTLGCPVEQDQTPTRTMQTPTTLRGRCGPKISEPGSDWPGLSSNQSECGPRWSFRTRPQPHFWLECGPRTTYQPPLMRCQWYSSKLLKPTVHHWAWIRRHLSTSKLFKGHKCIRRHHFYHDVPRNLWKCETSLFGDVSPLGRASNGRNVFDDINEGKNTKMPTSQQL